MTRGNGRHSFSSIKIKKMSKGISRIYNDWINEHKNKILKVRYMDIVYTDMPETTIEEYLEKGIEAGTLFKNWMDWAVKYGYSKGACPMSEYLTSHIVMVPNYFK